MIAAEVPQKRYFSHNFCGARYGCHMTTPVDDLYCKPAFNISNGDDSFEACCILTYIL